MTSVRSRFLKILNYVSSLIASFLLLASVGLAAEPDKLYSFYSHPQPRNYQLATAGAAKALTDAGCQLIREQRYADAIEKLEGALVLVRNVPCVYANLGLALSRNGQPMRAIDYLKIAVHLAPHEPAPLLTLASAYQRAGRMQEACSTYGKFLTSFPHDPEVTVVKGLVQGLRQEIDRIAHVKTGVEPDRQNNYVDYATSSTDVRWEKGKRVLTVFVNPNWAAPAADHAEECLREAFQKWQDVGCFSFRFCSAEEAANADILCSWTDDPAELSNPAEGGETRLRYKQGTIRKATLTLLTTRGKTVAETSELSAVALHEVGHCLGIVGHSPSPRDVMYFSINPDFSGANSMLSARDVETLRTLYPHSFELMPLDAAINSGDHKLRPSGTGKMGCLQPARGF